MDREKRTAQYEALRLECDQLDNLQRSGTGLSAAQHGRMAQLLVALSEDETAPEWVIARAQQALAHAALAALPG
jgi:hypothetical protein